MKEKHCPIRPLHNYVVCELIDAPDKTPGGILLPDNAKQRSQKGRVLAVGPGRPSEDGKFQHRPSVDIGHIVLFRMHAGAEIEIEGDEYKILNEQEILGVLEK